jgi:mannose-6-phosphate isomerase-like protein (cupin superfamily)
MKELAWGCRVYEPTEGDITTRGAWTARTVIDGRAGPAAIVQTISDYVEGPSPAMVNPRAEENLYVVSGTGVCHIDGFVYPLRPGAALFVPPGAVARIEADGPQRLRVISTRYPDEPERHAVDAPAPAPPAGPAPRLLVHEDECAAEIAGTDRVFRVLAHPDMGATRMTQFVGWIPTSKAPFHWHTYEECIWIAEGDGILHLKGQSGAAELHPGTSILLPRHTVHCLENAGRSPIRLLGVFHPAGSPGAAYEDA